MHKYYRMHWDINFINDNKIMDNVYISGNNRILYKKNKKIIKKLFTTDNNYYIIIFVVINKSVDKFNKRNNK
jgi:hypothetical protein